MRYASIDIGTNTILMLIGEIDSSLSIERIRDFYEVPRLGKNVSHTKELAAESMKRAFSVLRKYSSIAKEYKVEKIIASATSAVRDATNREAFIAPVESDFGIEVEIISGATEAKLSYMGAVSGAKEKNVPTLVVDIGGGSTELSYGTAVTPANVASIDVGAVRVTEKFFSDLPPSADEIIKANEFIRNNLSAFVFPTADSYRVFAVAGTATTLALIAQKKYEFDVSAVTNYQMTSAALRDVIDLLRVKSPTEILCMTEAAKGRADVLLAGALILMNVLEASGAQEFIATDRGLRYGYLLHKHMQSLEK